MKFKLLSSMVMLVAGMVFSIAVQAGEGHAMAKGVMAHGAWVRLVPPVAKNSAAYMELQNTGDEILQVTSASSPVAEVVEVHRTTMEDGVMRMTEIKDLQVPVDGKVQLKPGGYHIMLIKLKAPLKKDQVVPVTLKFTTGQVLTVNAHVKAMQGKMAHQHKH